MLKKFLFLLALVSVVFRSVAQAQPSVQPQVGLAVSSISTMLQYVADPNGESGGGWGFIATTLNGETPPDSNLKLNDVIFLPSQGDAFGSVIACGVGGTILRSVDGGITWTFIESPTTADLLALAFFPSQGEAFGSVIACGVGGTILRSIDGGLTWEVIDSPTTADLHAIAVFSDPQLDAFGTAIACGVGGTILRTVDGGAVWEVIDSPTRETLYSVAAFDAQPVSVDTDPQPINPQSDALGTAVACGVGGTILRTTDTGITWVAIDSPTAADLYSVTVCSSPDIDAFGTAIACGVGGTILRSIDSGSNWEVIDSPTTADLYDLVAVPSNSPLEALGTAVACGVGGTILRTADNGATWAQEASPTNDNLYAVAWSHNSGAGNRTSAAATSTAFSKGTSDATPASFKLMQNYPNPFNPETVMSYQLSVTSRVSLNVYDMLGRKVAELVNSQQAAGNYAVKFNASALSSGIYFYRLQAGSFVETKKMLLVK